MNSDVVKHASAVIDADDLGVMPRFPAMDLDACALLLDID